MQGSPLLRQWVEYYFDRPWTSDFDLRKHINEIQPRGGLLQLSFLQYVIFAGLAPQVKRTSLINTCLTFHPNVNYINTNGYTALAYCTLINAEATYLLCMAGADVELGRCKDTVPLAYAHLRGNCQAANVLIRFGAKCQAYARLPCTWRVDRQVIQDYCIVICTHRDPQCALAIIALLNVRFRKAKQLPHDVALIICRMLWAPKMRRSKKWDGAFNRGC
jgi:hypothetical protein